MHRQRHTIRSPRRQHGAAAILAMMFLVIFASLATAMAIVSQGNLRTADSHLKMNRALSAAETGMDFLIYRIDLATAEVKTAKGLIDHDTAQSLWPQVIDKLLYGDEDYEYGLANDEQFIGNEPYSVDGVIYIPSINIAPAGGSPTFSATLEPHPLAGEDYDSDFYKREPYSDMPVNSTNPLDASWVRIKVTGADGPIGGRIYRTITMDFRMGKHIRYAILAKSRVMIGRNVMIEGRIGSKFLDTHLPNGHPVLVLSDFQGLTSELDARLKELTGTLITNDQDHDNRINIYDPAETDGIPGAASLDYSGDGYIDDYDFLLEAFDGGTTGSTDTKITLAELESGGLDAVAALQLFNLINTFGNPNRVGYNDDYIDEYDRYAKIRGEIKIAAAVEDWENGAVALSEDGETYQDFLQGPIVPDHNEDAVTFEADDDSISDYDAGDFDTGSFVSMATNDVYSQASPEPGTVVEKVPFGSRRQYDWYERPVFFRKTFQDTLIPLGTNALFVDCEFIGVTFVQAETNNFIAAPPEHENPTINVFHYTGMWEDEEGTAKHPDLDAHFQTLYPALTSSKDMGNNIRFDNCTFHGAIITSAPLHFSHTRNKLAFTGTTRFIIDDSPYLDDDEKKLFKRSTLLAPNFSIEMGTFIAPHDATETVELSGTIVAGILDMRGQVKINGTILTTFAPVAGEGPVLGDTSPNFNTTLGYFPSSAGDLEAELPTTGLGVIQVRYDPTIPMPDGILGRIDLTPVYGTYFEGEGE